MMEQADPAVRQLQQIAFDDTNPLDIRFKATMAIIDRVGLAPRTQVELEVNAAPHETIFEEMDLGGSRSDYRGEPELLPIEDTQSALVAEYDAEPPLDDDDVLDVEVVPDEPERGSPFDSASPFAQTPAPDGLMSLETAVSAAAEMRRHATQRAITRK